MQLGQVQTINFLARSSSCVVRSSVAGVTLWAELMRTLPGVIMGMRSDRFKENSLGAFADCEGTVIRSSNKANWGNELLTSR